MFKNKSFFFSPASAFAFFLVFQGFGARGEFLATIQIELPPKFIRGGGTSESDGFWFQSGGLHLNGPVPGIVYGMAKGPNGIFELKYLVIFKHQAKSNSIIGYPSKMNDLGGKERVVTIIDGVKVDGKMVDITMKIEIDSRAKMITRETMDFSKTRIDLSKGRLFLVDFTGEKIKWEQISTPLPKVTSELTDIKDIEEFAKKVLNTIPKDSQNVADFIK